jgi:hypothetical protein
LVMYPRYIFSTNVLSLELGYDPRGLPGVTIARPVVAGVLSHPKNANFGMWLKFTKFFKKILNRLF